MTYRTLFIIPVCTLFTACGGPYFPEGDVTAGRKVFEKMECYTCHRVSGDKFPDPTVDPPVPVVLGAIDKSLSRNYLAEAVIAPSHKFSRPPVQFTFIDPPMTEYVQPEYENIKEGELSRMGDFSNSMTVREWIDIVAYLESLQ